MINWLKNIFKKQDNLNITLNINRPTHDEIKQIIIDEANKNINKSDIWSIIINITQLAIPSATIIGAFFVYFYLKKLDAVSLFAEIISTPSSLIAIITSFFIAISTFLFYLNIIQRSIQTIKHITPSEGKILLIPSFLFPILILLAILIPCIRNFYSRNEILYSFLCFFISPILSCVIIYIFKHENSFKALMEIFFISLYLNILHLIMIFFSYMPNYWFNINELDYHDFKIISISIIYMLCFYKIYTSMITNLWLLNKKSILFIVCIAFINIDTGRIFTSLGYIEENTDARWYLLDTRFINQYGLVKKEGTTGLNDKDTLIEWQKKFSVNDKIDSKMDNNQTDYSKTYKNAVYGYMAWNLGKTKIFCPYHLTIEDAEKRKTKLDKICLTINGDYLQPIPDGLRL